jgi:DNA-binding transcriptional LysR family regulator
MQIESLKVFAILAETESFTKAAQINNVTQSAVSQQISSLERQFKSLLIERSKKKFRLTREGQVLYDYSKQIIQTYDSLHSKLQEFKDIISGTIRVATIYSIGLHDLPPYIKRFMKSYPTVNIHVEYRRANQVYDDVLSNVVDLASSRIPPQNSNWKSSRCAKTRSCSSAIRSIRSRNKKREAQGACRAEIHRLRAGHPDAQGARQNFEGHGVEVKHVMEFDNIETVKRAVEIDAGISIVPQGTIVQEVAKQTLAAVLEDGEFFRPLAAIYKKNKVLSPGDETIPGDLKETAR